MSIKHALVVDDSKSARFSLKKLLQQQDIKTDFAESAGDALNYLSSHSPDIIFMDHLMPGMDGFEATKAIKGNPDIQNIPIIMCTSKEGSDYAEQALAIGAYAILPKPAPAATLTAILNQLGTDVPDGVAPSTTDKKPATAGQLSSRMVENIARKAVDERLEQFQKQFKQSVFEPFVRETDEKLQSLSISLKSELSVKLDSQIRDQANSISQKVSSEIVDARFNEFSTEFSAQIKESLEKVDDLLSKSDSPSSALLEEVKKTAQFTAAATAGETATSTAESISQTVAQDTAQKEMETMRSNLDESVQQLLAESAPKGLNPVSIAALVISLVALAAAFFV